ncbi:probable chitinase 10 [Uloborus diversus]|uniref:probable chitinase 10 n=1 Tax=Uloborus diversus TaxID=327109 RepID=UPI00240942AF|nr:probable chitinase 10 [Uloborus diversus]
MSQKRFFCHLLCFAVFFALADLYAAQEDPLKICRETKFCGKRVTCLFNTQSYYKVNFTPDKIMPEYCTHVNYEFARLDPKKYTIMEGDLAVDVGLNFMNITVDLKKRLFTGETKIMLALGGWRDSTKKYSELMETDERRKNFVSHAVKYLKDHNFDGMDFSFQYPNCWQGAIGVHPDDKENFVKILQELKPAFEAEGLVLSISVSAVKREVEAAYDMPAIAKTVDFINVMTYDMHGPWEPKTGHHAQFKFKENDEDPDLNVEAAMKIWADGVGDPSMLNLGIPLYAKTFTLTDPAQHGLGAPASGPGKPGPRTLQGGYMSYNEVCEELRSGSWGEEFDFEVGWYIYKNDQWACHVPPQMAVQFAKFAVEKGYGGVLLKELSGDDVDGKCDTPFVITKMVGMEMVHEVRRSIRKKSKTSHTSHTSHSFTYVAGSSSDESVHASLSSKNSVEREDSESDSSDEDVSEESLPPMKIVCYFSSASFYKVNFNPNVIDPTLCTHIIYNFASLNDSYHLDVGDRYVDIDQGYYDKVTSLKSRNPSLKVLLAVGGWNDSTRKYSDMAADPSKIVSFVDSSIPFLQQHNFDGLDVAWEYPNCWQGNCGVNPADVPNFITLLTALRAAYAPESLLLTASVSPVREEIEEAYDVPNLNQLLDFINVMTYDFHGGWEKNTGHHAQFAPTPNDLTSSLNVNTSVNHWISSGADRSKLIVGIPSYGRSFTLAAVNNSGLNAAVLGPGEPGKYTQEPGFLGFNELCEDINNWELYSDHRAGEYAVKGDLWVGYDSPKRAVKKARYIQRLGLGGAAYKHFYTDDYKGTCYGTQFPILRSIQYALLNKHQDFERKETDMEEFMRKIQLTVLVSENQDVVDHEEKVHSDASASDVLIRMTATELSSTGEEQIKEIKINAGTLDVIGENNGHILDLMQQAFATGGSTRFVGK